MPRASAGDRAAHVADALRMLVAKLAALADLLSEPDGSDAGPALGPDDELTPEDQARVDSAVARFRQRSKRGGTAQRALAPKRQPTGTRREPRRRGGTP